MRSSPGETILETRIKTLFKHRALRYYYDGDMICKVHGKRFVYKFVCDLKQLLGYSASELSKLVEEAERRSINRSNSHLLASF